MSRIKVEKSNFADKGSSVEYREGFFTCSRGPGAGLTLSAANIIDLNRQPKAERVSAAPFPHHHIAEQDFRDVEKFGAFLAKLFGIKLKNRSVIIKFKNDKYLRGKTDVETFFAIQNAWLDSK